MTRRDNVEYGDREVALPNEILRSVVGSGVHGIAIEGTDDHDEMGVFIAPPEHALSPAEHREDYVWRTQPDDVWVVFRFPGLLILTVLFGFAQVPLMMKYAKTDEPPPPHVE